MGSEMFIDHMRKAMSDPRKATLRVINNAPGEKLFQKKKKKERERKEECPFVVLGFKMTLLYPVSSSGDLVLLYIVLFSRNSWCFKGYSLFICTAQLPPTLGIFILGILQR